MAAAQVMGKGRRSPSKKKPKKWIQGVRSEMKRKGTVGALRKQLGAKKGKPIPESKLQAAKAKGGQEAKRAQFALNMRRLKK